MGKRIEFIYHEGIRVLSVDLSHCAGEEVERVFREIPNIVSAEPRGSVLLLADFTATVIDGNALMAMKESAVFNKPFVRKSAWVGADHILDFRDLVSAYSRRDFPTFKTRHDALHWLVLD